jgi:intein-encoded DNA endonuclease-like protein
LETSGRGKRLPREVIRFIKEENASYREIKDKIRLKWNIEVAKSTISYYKRQKPRIKPLSLDAIPTEDWNWLQGLFSADGNKIISKDKYGKHYVVRISLDKTSDSLIAEKIVRIVKAIGLVPTRLLRGNCVTIKISSKLLFNALNKIPEKSSVTAAYIAGAIDGDGWVDHRAIQFGQSRVPELFDAVLDFFNGLNLQIETWTKRDEPNYRRMYIPFSVLKSRDILKHSIKAQRLINCGGNVDHK